MPEFDFFQGRFNLLPVKYEIKKQKPENESWLNRFLSQYKKCNSMEMELQKPYAKDLSRWINLTGGAQVRASFKLMKGGQRKQLFSFNL